MASRFLAFAAAVVIALAVSGVLRRRRADAPTQGGFQVPTQIDRTDFPSVVAPWLIVAFTSATCNTCDDVVTKARVMECDEVAVVRVDYTEMRGLHARYRIEAVPAIVVVDPEGVVRAAFLGPVKAQDLWAAVAECRAPGSTPEPQLGRGPVEGQA